MSRSLGGFLRGVGNAPKKLAARNGIRAASRQLLEAPRTEQSSLKRLRDAVSMLMTFKVDDNDRLSILEAVCERVAEDLADSNIPLLVSDASPDSYSSLVQPRVAAISPQFVYRRDDLPMTECYLKLLDDCSTPYCYLQFEDQITTNLSSRFLLAASRLLERYNGLVPVVTAVWPLEVQIDDVGRSVSVLTYRHRRPKRLRRESFEFGEAHHHRPVLIDEVDGYRFGIFENFYYGFYFNHIVTRADDYAQRLRWYMEAVKSVGVHEIELAASDRTFGPIWTHVAVCLDGMTLLDVDHSHTSASVRPATSSARDVHHALSNGFDIRTFHVDVE